MGVFYFLMLPFDAVASSALIVAALWTKVAGRSNFSLFSSHVGVGRPSKRSWRRLCNEGLA